ncbi:transglutaminase-like domain-containing protein [Lachnospiraceae bacterium 46-15]
MKKKQTGIKLIQPEYEAGLAERILGLSVLLIYFYLGLFGCVLGFLSVFKIPCDFPLLSGALLFMGLFFAVVCLAGKYTKLLIILTCLVYAWLIYQNFDLLLEGGSVAEEVIHRVISAYQTGGAAKTRDIMPAAREALLFLLTVIFPWAAILFTGFLLHGGRMFAFVSMAAVVSASLAVGKIPDFLPLCMMIGCFSGALATDGLSQIKGQRAGVFFLTALLALLMAGGSHFLAPSLEPYFSDAPQIKKKLQNTSVLQEINRWFSDWNSTWAAAGIGNGELGNADFVSDQNKDVLRVTLDEKPKDIVYLRCYTGTEYTGDKWAAAEDPLEETVYQRALDSLDASLYTDSPLRHTMRVELQEDAGDYAYRPYLSRPAKKKDGSLSYTCYFRDQLNERYYTCLPLSAEDELEYSGFVYQNYTSYPEERLEKLRDLCSSYQPQDFLDLCNFIIGYLHQNATYSLSVGHFPEDKDFTEYFLFEKHEGYCVHFATAATLMFRMYGVPSRYVTGYIVPRDAFRKNGKEYRAWVKDSQAHAWTEIYLSGQGWVPIEVTPGYSQASIDENETVRQTDSQNQPITRPQNESGTGARKDQENGFFTAVTIWILCILLLLALAVFAVCQRRRLLLKQRRQQDVREIFCDICKMMPLAGFQDEADCQDEAFSAGMLKQFPWLEPESVSRLLDMAVRANFDCQPMTKEERAFSWDIYREFCRHIYPGLPLWKKAVFKLLYVFA